MKYSCVDCGRQYYTDQRVNKCVNCGAEVEQIKASGREVTCIESKKSVRLIRGIPNCDNFRLVNAIGNRCTRSESLKSCRMAELPKYNPRVGVEV